MTIWVQRPGSRVSEQGVMSRRKGYTDVLQIKHDHYDLSRPITTYHYHQTTEKWIWTKIKGGSGRSGCNYGVAATKHWLGLDSSQDSWLLPPFSMLSAPALQPSCQLYNQNPIFPSRSPTSLKAQGSKVCNLPGLNLQAAAVQEPIWVNPPKANDMHLLARVCAMRCGIRQG